MTKQNATTSEGWNFNNSYSRLPETFFTRLNPTPVRFPKLVMLNYPLARDLGLNDKFLESENGVAVLAGNLLPEDALPLAQAYAGHQFGHFTMLGDGRALLLGEQITPRGERFDIQLKGAGKTPYSRGGDGRAALGLMLREYIISEAMHALGIPTTRSLAVVTTAEPVFRETVLPGAILIRVAASHLRVGTFQYVSKWGTVEELRILADYTLQRHFPDAETAVNKYLFLLQEIVRRQAKLIAKWQLVGFIHGVMNTDNMALSGETIDYGPCAFMDSYDQATVFSSIDKYGRYAYGNQPRIAAWNLARFAETLLPLLDNNEDMAIKLAENALASFAEIYLTNWLAGMRAKLGILNEEPEDESLINNLLSLMSKYHADYTNTFLALTFETIKDTEMFCSAEFNEWHKLWQTRLGRQQDTLKSNYQKLMRNNNPALIPRNYRVEEALEAAIKHEDYSVMQRLLRVLSSPFAHSPEQSEFSLLPKPPRTPYVTFCGT